MVKIECKILPRINFYTEMWCEISGELCQITDPVQILLLSYLKHLFYVSESNKDKSTSELHFLCGIAVETEGV